MHISGKCVKHSLSVNHRLVNTVNNIGNFRQIIAHAVRQFSYLIINRYRVRHMNNSHSRRMTCLNSVDTVLYNNRIFRFYTYCICRKQKYIRFGFPMLNLIAIHDRIKIIRHTYIAKCFFGTDTPC